MLSLAQIGSFHDTGFLVVPGFFTDVELAAVSGAYDAAWTSPATDVVVDSIATGRRFRISDATDVERLAPAKVNDLYLVDHLIRDVALSERLGTILRELFGEDPVLCNTLSVAQGTQQADHLDTLFMTPKTPGRLIATWMALEDVDPDAGPLRFFPESNHIAPYRFADGGYHARDSEMEQWSDYMAGEVERFGLADTLFVGKRGDLFIWDAWLLHGGSQICEMGLTRKSMISHYFTASDCKLRGLESRLKPTPGGWWLERTPAPLEGDALAQRAVVRIPPPAPSPELDLRERLDQLTVDHP